MKALFYSTKLFEQGYLVQANAGACELIFTQESLSLQTSSRAKGFEVISVFAGDDGSASVIKVLASLGVKYIAVRAAGYDNIDLDAASANEITVAHVPAYSPFAVAEHATALLLALNRKLVIANKQVKDQNFSLDNLIGFDLKGKTVGIIGTGRIGAVFARIMHGFGCRLLGYDVVQNKDLNSKFDLQYVSLEQLCRKSDVISIHTPLTTETKHLINTRLIHQMKTGVIIINTARGAVVKTNDIVTYLQNGQIGAYGMDVYEKEKGIFFYNHHGKDLNDPTLQKLLTMPNVLVTPHQGFATKEALQNIAETTFENIKAWTNYSLSGNELTKKISIKL